jgi:hypothetical protein
MTRSETGGDSLHCTSTESATASRFGNVTQIRTAGSSDGGDGAPAETGGAAGNVSGRSGCCVKKLTLGPLAHVEGFGKQFPENPPEGMRGWRRQAADRNVRIFTPLPIDCDIRHTRSSQIDPVPMVKSGSTGAPSSRPNRCNARSWMLTCSAAGANT